MGGPVTIIDGHGKLASKDGQSWFPEDANGGSDAMNVVVMIGAPRSGKSTLLNESIVYMNNNEGSASFSSRTLFPVSSSIVASFGEAKDGKVGLKAVKAKTDILVFEVLSDARNKEQVKIRTKCAKFAAALADVVLVNLRVNEIGRLESVAMELLEGILDEVMKTSADESGMKTKLVFVVRDADTAMTSEHELAAMIMDDVKMVWDGKAKPGVKLEDYFEIQTIALPHPKLGQEEFTVKVKAFGESFATGGSMLKPEFSKGIPIDSFSVFAQGMWESVFADTSLKGLDRSASYTASGSAPADAATITAVDEAFSKAYDEAKPRLDRMNESLSGGDLIDKFGASAKELLESALQVFDNQCQNYASSDTAIKYRSELEASIKRALSVSYIKQLQLIRQHAISTYKTSTASEDTATEFAFFSADNIFVNLAKESTADVFDWSYEQERTELQNALRDLSAQRKRIISARLQAAQQQANTMRVLQTQQNQLQAVQQHAYGGGDGQLNLGAAYRPTDTNLNLSVGYQQGRTNVQISVVPDEYASFLGPNGFSQVGPANLGLSFNVSI